MKRNLKGQAMRIEFKSWTAAQQRQWLDGVIDEHVYYSAIENAGWPNRVAHNTDTLPCWHEGIRHRQERDRLKKEKENT